jgi:aminoglycoside/choline kinase family phosphotransferase
MTDNSSGEAARRLTRLAEEHFGVIVAKVTPLAGDASDRSYIRLHHPEAAAPSSIGMILASSFAGEELTFLNVGDHFREIGIPVPEVYASDPEAGLLLLEDGGDDSLEEVWSAGGWEAARPYYEESICLLARLQAAPRERKGALALGYRFDAALFERELHMTRRCAFEDLLGIPAPEEDFAAPFARMASELCALPYALTHRDFHCRNLMADSRGKGSGRLLVLDFQDARLGPLTYDLASLVYDSYVALPEGTRSALIDLFWSESAAPVLFPDRASFDLALSLTALQRNLKAIGTFAYQKTGRGNSRYIQYIPHTASLARRHLEALPDGWHGFAARLGPYICTLEEMEKEMVH